MHLDIGVIPTPQVEDVLFKVPKNFLIRDSSLFETTFACPSGSEDAEGVTEARPIVLPSVKVEEFEILMDFYHDWSVPAPPVTKNEGPIQLLTRLQDGQRKPDAANDSWGATQAEIQI